MAHICVYAKQKGGETLKSIKANGSQINTTEYCTTPANFNIYTNKK